MHFARTVYAVVIAATAFLSAPVFASPGGGSATPYPVADFDHHQGRTRAQVRAELKQAQADGSLEAIGKMESKH